MASGNAEYDKLFYPYPFNKTLKNKFNEYDRSKLKLKEENATSKRFIMLDEGKLEDIINGKFDTEHLLKLHKFIFQDCYSWAGKFKVADLGKSQDILGGASVKYCPPEYLTENLNDVFRGLNNTKWDELSYTDKIIKFADKFQYLWQCHPFNEGNTRTTSKFMEAFAKAKNIPVDFNKLFDNPKDLRNSFVLYSTGESDCKKAMFKFFLDSALDSDTLHPSLEIPERFSMNLSKEKEEKVIKIKKNEMEMD